VCLLRSIVEERRLTALAALPKEAQADAKSFLSTARSYRFRNPMLAPNAGKVAHLRQCAVVASHEHDGRIMGANVRAGAARQEAKKTARAPDLTEAEAWSVRMEGYGGPAQRSPTIGQCLDGGYGWLEIECCRCKTRASLPFDAIAGRGIRRSGS